MTGQMEHPRQQEIQPHKSDGIRTAFGAMGVYGGVQAVQILAGLIRGKVSAGFLRALPTMMRPGDWRLPSAAG